LISNALELLLRTKKQLSAEPWDLLPIENKRNEEVIDCCEVTQKELGTGIHIEKMGYVEWDGTLGTLVDK
jgi:hypothetical protein